MAEWDGLSDRRNGGGLHPEARAMFATLIERVDNLKTTFKEHTDEDDKRFEKIEKRIEPIEKGAWKALGGATVIAAIVGWLSKHWGG